MNDFRNSVADLDVGVATAVSVSSSVGDNFYKFLYITGKDSTILDADTAPRLVTKDTYESVVDTVIASTSDRTLTKKNLASIFALAPNVQGYIIDKVNYSKFKYYAYWVYIETSCTYSGGTLSFDSTSQGLINAVDASYDKAFSAVLLDIPVVASSSITTYPSSSVASLLASLNTASFAPYTFARGATDSYEWSDASISIGFSPALYQLGKTLSSINGTGTPIGSSVDTVACTFQDVLPSRNTNTSILVNASVDFMNWCKNNNLAYFKTIGNGTGQIACSGGWSLKHTSVCADWIVAYVNFMTKVDCAEIITASNTYKNQKTYNKCIAAMTANVAPFISIGRVYNYVETAPSWADAQALSDGETIVIPEAWSAWFADNVRKVQIQGNLTV